MFFFSLSVYLQPQTYGLAIVFNASRVIGKGWRLLPDGELEAIKIRSFRTS